MSDLFSWALQIHLSLWVVIVLGVAAVVGVVSKIARKAARAGRKAARIADQWLGDGTDDHPSIPDRLTAIEGRQVNAEAELLKANGELFFNHGSSLRDAIDGPNGIRNEIVALREQSDRQAAALAQHIEHMAGRETVPTVSVAVATTLPAGQHESESG